MSKYSKWSKELLLKRIGELNTQVELETKILDAERVDREHNQPINYGNFKAENSV